jgi:probable HAF family extracellular repeat protein
VTVTNDPQRTPLYNIIDIGATLGPESSAYGINNNGVIVGGSSTTYSDSLPFLYTNGTVISPPIIFDIGLGGDGIAFAVNDAGVAVGEETSSSTGLGHAIRFQGTNIVNLGTLGGIESFAYAINNSGQIVGYAYDTNEASRAFLYSGGKMTNLDAFGATDSAATAINSSGQIAGWARFSGSSTLGFILNPGGSNQFLGTLGGWFSEPTAMNDAGEVAGISDTANDSADHAFLSLQGFMVDLGTLGDDNSAALGMNNYGEVVGWSGYQTPESRAFLWQNDVMYDLNELIPTNSGWVLQSANAINDQGQIVGYGSFSNQLRRAFLLTLATNSPVTPQDSQLLFYVDGNFSLNLPVPIGTASVVQTSSNLVDWVPVATNYDRNGLVNFSDPHAGQTATRFYRAIPFTAPSSH